MDKEEELGKWESQDELAVNVGIPKSISLFACPDYLPDCFCAGIQSWFGSAKLRPVALGVTCPRLGGCSGCLTSPLQDVMGTHLHITAPGLPGQADGLGFISKQPHLESINSQQCEDSGCEFITDWEGEFLEAVLQCNPVCRSLAAFLLKSHQISDRLHLPHHLSKNLFLSREQMWQKRVKSRNNNEPFQILFKFPNEFQPHTDGARSAWFCGTAHAVLTWNKDLL